MKQWEYLVIMEPQNLGMVTLQRHLTEAGEERWELAGILGLTFIFKREKLLVTQ